ncbi:MAG: subclass B3 metallo-beta-lactamase [Pseudomonadota bacterium]
MNPTRALSAITITLGACGAPAEVWDEPKNCVVCAGWNDPVEPYKIHGDTYYVGVAQLTSVLIASDAGHILIDGALPESAPLIDANIRALGFRTEDIKLMLNSHAHFDHAGGFAGLQRVSGAPVATSARGAAALKAGGPIEADPQFGLGADFNSFPPVETVRVVEDGETLTVGALAVTALHTPGHTPGGASWAWRSCEGGTCVDMLYADSLNAVSAPAFRFTGAEAEAALRESIAKISGAACDVLIPAHPQFASLDEKRARRAAGEADAFINAGDCAAYALAASERLDQRLRTEARLAE